MLAAIGVYGVLSMLVAQRSREFGIRMVLGARRGDVFRLVPARCAVLAVAGAVIGLLAASGVTRALRSFLFGVSPLDPLTFVVGAGTLIAIAIALVASYVPARRATKGIRSRRFVRNDRRPACTHSHIGPGSNPINPK